MFYLGGRCLCNGTVTNIKKYGDCPDCIQVASVYVPCFEMPDHGNEGVVPISQYNKYEVCEDGYDIEIKSVPDNVTAVVDSDENIEFVVSAQAASEDLVIHYKVSCTNSGLSSNGFITLCNSID